VAFVTLRDGVLVSEEELREFARVTSQIQSSRSSHFWDIAEDRHRENSKVRAPRNRQFIRGLNLCEKQNALLQLGAAHCLHHIVEFRTRLPSPECIYGRQCHALVRFAICWTV